MSHVLTRLLRIRVVLLVSAALLVGCPNDKEGAGRATARQPAGEMASAKPDVPTAQIDIDNPATCAGCHAAVAAEWNESMHARAHQSKDPIFGKMRALRMKKQGEQIAFKCANCHTARDPEQTKTSIAEHGVSCATCHNVAHVDTSGGKRGGKAFTWAPPSTLLGPHDVAAGKSPVHQTGAAPAHMKDGNTLCLACHDATKTPSGADACTTGPEWRGDKAGGASTCVDCHMPETDGPASAVTTRKTHRSHAFLGPHRAWYQKDDQMLAASVTLSGAFKDDAIEVTLENKSGHGFPTGFPGRMAFVVVEGFDKKGASVYKSAPDSPTSDTPFAVFRKVYVDDAGKPAPAAFAKALKEDTRLTSDESRTVTFKSVPKTVHKVSVALVYRLLPPPLAKKLGLEGSLEAEPRVAKRIEIVRE